MVDGSGVMIALALGKNSYAGKAKELIKQAGEDDQKTPLTEKLEVAATQLGYISLVLATLLIVIITLKPLFTSN